MARRRPGVPERRAPVRAAADALARAEAALQDAAAQGSGSEEALAHVRAAREALAATARVPSEPVLGLTRRVVLEPGPWAASTARRACAETCAEWGLPPALTSTAVDVVGELVANAARLGSGPVVLVLELDPFELLVRVWDDAPGAPRVLPYRPGVSEHGLGLQLVRRLSRRWGSTPGSSAASSRDAGRGGSAPLSGAAPLSSARAPTAGKWVWAALDRGRR